MNDAQREFLAAWEAQLTGYRDELRERTRSLLEKQDQLTTDVTLSDANVAYARITKAADRIMERRDVSREQAIAEALKQRPELYDAYSEGLAKAQAEGGTAGLSQSQERAAADLVRWARERLETVSDPAAYRNELVSHPQMVAALRTVSAADRRREQQEQAAARDDADRVEKHAKTRLWKRRRAAKAAPVVAGLDDQPARVRKSGETLLDFFEIPFVHEGKVIDEIRKDGSDEVTVTAAVLAFRSLAQVWPDLSAGSRRAVRDAFIAAQR
jgi:hypothetical protein